MYPANSVYVCRQAGTLARGRARGGAGPTACVTTGAAVGREDGPARHRPCLDAPPRGRDIWSRAEVRKLLRAAAPTRLHAAWRLSLYGLRRGEVLGLRWSDIDLNAKTLTVHQARAHADCKVGGVPISIISKWAGHYDSSFTMKTYVHASDDDLKQGRQALAKIHRLV